MNSQSLPLEKWQERLERHFEALARTRSDSGFPIFALEHGLNHEELEEISSLLRLRVESRLTLSPHWLLWVVYATERGYSYAGDEYWSSFEEHTPNWEFSDRYKLVPWFTKFQKKYDGVIPSGPWANHFRIISWPITHAILPRYLQRQFARALYDLRFRLAGLTSLKPDAIGRLLAANIHHASTRFEEFLQQEELAGRIVLALLDASPAEGEGPIYPVTLQRIVADLEKVRSSREWLKEARRIVGDRFKGIGSGSRQKGQHLANENQHVSKTDRSQIDIRPNLLLRHTGASTWQVVMEVPSFRSVAAINPDVQAFLRNTRCRLNGADDLKPAGWLLSGNRKGIIKTWPDAAKPLILTEQSHGVVDHLLQSECRLSSGRLWLFRISSDGTAREIIGRILRPGSSYVVITVGDLPEPRPFVGACSVDCSGIKSFRVLVPSDVTAEDIAWFQRLGLQVARTIHVWPAGLPGRSWDGEGNGEWLTTEAPCFGIVHDHPVDAYAVSLNSGEVTLISAGLVGRPVFVRLHPLPAGMHSLSIKVRRSASLDMIAPSSVAEGFVQLKVREPEAWNPGVLSHPGLIVTLDPHEPTLDTFWKNEVSLSVRGPEGHSVTFYVTLRGTDGEECLSEQIDGSMTLPVTPEKWSSKFSQFLQREENAWSYLEATSGCLAIKGETLGECVLTFEHDVLPLRWSMRRAHGEIILRLIDDTGFERRDQEVYFFNMQHPLKMEQCTGEKAMSGITVKPVGGLYVARHGEHSSTVVISTGLTAQGLQGLSINPEYSELSNGSVTPLDSLRLLGLWRGARLSGFLVNLRHHKVIEGLLAAIYGRLAGQNWMRVESAYLRNPELPSTLDALVRAVHRHNSFAVVLQRDYSRMDDDIVQATNWFSDLAARYQICSDRELCKFALRLASQPDQLIQECDQELDNLLDNIITTPVILRGARLLALLSANQKSDGPVLMLPRWKW